MADIDYGRKMDLEELADAMKDAKSTSEREHYERIAYRILSESPEIKYWRQKLIMASRHNDLKAIDKIVQRMQNIRQHETYGKSWGNQKGNESVN